MAIARARAVAQEAAEPTSMLPVSSDASYLPSSIYTQEELLPSTAPGIAPSEIEYITDRAIEQRLALEQRVIERLRKITNMPIDLGSARSELGSERSAIQLTPEQTRVHQIAVKERASIFFTGAAGTGKSILLQKIISDLKKTIPGGVAVTASTGIAACAIGGRTIHSWAGVGLGLGEREKLLKTVRRSKAASTHWKTAGCLVIDEVSMLSPELLDNLDFIGKRLRGSPAPFGGIQVILTGDFFQLPPVDKDRIGERQYAFDAQCWKKLVQRTILLTQVFRQRDEKFQTMLNEVRHGKISAETCQNFAALNRPPPHMPAEITPTRLYSRRHEVEQANKASLAKLQEEAVEFVATDVVYPPPPRGDDDMGPRPPPLDFSKITWLAPEQVTLKKGAQVMMIKNIDGTLVNGSIGRILGWVEEPPLPPATPAERAKNVIDISSMINELHNCSYQRLEKFEKSLAGEGKRAEGKLPLVRFFNQNGTFRDVILQRETWNFENEYGEVLASRTQIPLILAYALSIHKSQGQTLDYVHIDMRSVFEVGQAYVALSRATHIDGLQLVGFSPSRVKCEPRVAAFYNGLERVMQPLVSDMFNKNVPAKRELSEASCEDDGQAELDAARKDFFAAFKRPTGPEAVKREPSMTSVTDENTEPSRLDPFASFKQHDGRKTRYDSAKRDQFEAFRVMKPNTVDQTDAVMATPPAAHNFLELDLNDPLYDSDFDGDYKFEERSHRFNRY